MWRFANGQAVLPSTCLAFPAYPASWTCLAFSPSHASLRPCFSILLRQRAFFSFSGFYHSSSNPPKQEQAKDFTAKCGEYGHPEAMVGTLDGLTSGPRTLEGFLRRFKEGSAEEGEDQGAAGPPTGQAVRYGVS